VLDCQYVDDQYEKPVISSPALISNLFSGISTQYVVFKREKFPLFAGLANTLTVEKGFRDPGL